MCYACLVIILSLGNFVECTYKVLCWPGKVAHSTMLTEIGKVHGVRCLLNAPTASHQPLHHACIHSEFSLTVTIRFGEFGQINDFGGLSKSMGSLFN